MNNRKSHKNALFRHGLKYINLGRSANNNDAYSSKPYYVNDRQSGGGPLSSASFFQGSAGLDSDAQLLSVDSVRGKCMQNWNAPIRDPAA